RSKKGSTVSASFSNELCARTTGSGPTFRRGDADANGAIELSDAIRILGFLFLGGAKPECMDAADFDDSGNVDISDAVSDLSYLFLGGQPPADPGPKVCGPDKLQEADQGLPELGCD